MAIISWQQSEPAGFSIRSFSHTHPQQYIYQTHGYVHAYLYTRPRSRVLLHWFRRCERGIGQTMNTKAHGRIETGQKRALVEAGRETEDFCLRSLITVLTYADENARMIGGLTGKGKKIIEKLIFSIPFDQWAKHRCVASSCVCSAAFGANTCDWLSSKGEIR